MRENPGLSVNALANAANASRSATGERLRQLGRRGVIEKGGDGRWRLGGGRGAPYGGVAVDLTAAPKPIAATPCRRPRPARWVRALASYERKEPHEFQVSRYG